MEIINRSRTGGRGKEYVKSEQKAKFNFDLSVLNLMCSYALSDNSEFKRSQFINLRELMNQLNIDLYINDTERMKRVQFIKKAIEAKKLNNVTLAVIPPFL